VVAVGWAATVGTLVAIGWAAAAGTVVATGVGMETELSTVVACVGPGGADTVVHADAIIRTRAASPA
jgi:hypothetical protein